MMVISYSIPQCLIAFLCPKVLYVAAYKMQVVIVLFCFCKLIHCKKNMGSTEDGF